MRRIACLAIVLLLVGVTSIAAQQPYSGTVLKVDPAAGVIVFQDGRMLQTTADSVIISGNQRTLLSNLRPGTGVTVYQAQPVVLRDGRYVLLQDAAGRTARASSPPASTVVTPAPPHSTAIVTQPPASTVVTPAPSPSTVVTQSQASVPAFEVAGDVLRADATGRVVALADGRKVHLTDDTQVLLNGVQPVPLSTLKPGSHVVIRSARPFAGGRDGTLAPMTEYARGTVVRVDQPGVLVLSDGRTVPTTSDTVIYMDRRPVTVTNLQPGTHVVVYRDGNTTVVTDPAASPRLYPEAGLREKEMDRQGR
jgi:hypothetical protein